MWGWGCAGLLVAALVGWIFSRSRAYRRHHYSVSVAGGYTSRVVGEMFTLFIARLLGVPFEALTLEVGRSAVHHAEFHLSAAEQVKFAELAIPKAQPAEITSFRKEYMEVRKHLLRSTLSILRSARAPISEWTKSRLTVNCVVNGLSA